MGERLLNLFSLAADDVAQIARQYQLGVPLEWRPLDGGVINSNYRLDTESGSYVLRVYAAERERTEVEFELSLLDHLQRSRFPAQRPVPTADGTLIGDLRGSLFAVLTFLPGRVVDQSELSIDLAEQVGAAYAWFRRVVDDFRPEGFRENADHPTVSSAIAQLLDERTTVDPEAARKIRQVWESVDHRFGSVPDQSLRVVHGDLFYENILVEDGRLVAFIDYDDAYLGLPLLDLALVVMEFSTLPNDRLNAELASAVLKGYIGNDGQCPATMEELYDGLLFLCCKFLCYTLPLTRKSGGDIAENSYFRRLVDLSDQDRREQLTAVFTDAHEVQR